MEISQKVTLFNFKCLKFKKISEIKSSVKSVLVLIFNCEWSTYNTCTQIYALIISKFSVYNYRILICDSCKRPSQHPH